MIRSETLLSKRFSRRGFEVSLQTKRLPFPINPDYEFDLPRTILRSVNGTSGIVATELFFSHSIFPALTISVAAATTLRGAIHRIAFEWISLACQS